MANAVIPTRSVLFPEAKPSSKDCLQRDPLPLPEQPPWQALAAQTLPSSSAPLVANTLPSDTVLEHIHPDIPSARIGSQLALSQRSVIKGILAKHNAVFARHDNDLGHFTGMQHRIDLLPDALPYSRSPYRKFIGKPSRCHVLDGIAIVISVIVMTHSGYILCGVP
uniref:Tick transposon n=1 Tax=Rhipicephalus zambeziensis TaxID=60191 RepID=A0A224ZA38_9ACAR